MRISRAFSRQTLCPLLDFGLKAAGRGARPTRPNPHTLICRKMGVSMETLFKILVPILVTMFVIGAAGCVIVIPVVAYRLFSVLVEPHAPDEQ
jgi:hypothetical protein